MATATVTGSGKRGLVSLVMPQPQFLDTVRLIQRHLELQEAVKAWVLQGDEARQTVDQAKVIMQQGRLEPEEAVKSAIKELYETYTCVLCEHTSLDGGPYEEILACELCGDPYCVDCADHTFREVWFGTRSIKICGACFEKGKHLL